MLPVGKASMYELKLSGMPSKWSASWDFTVGSVSSAMSLGFMLQKSKENEYKISTAASSGNGNRYFVNGVEAPALQLEPGETYVFDNIDNNLTGTFDSLTILNLNEGGKSMIAMSDINNDQKTDLIVGNYSGGLSYFSSDSLVISNTNNNYSSKELNIYPNPTSRYLSINNTISGDLVILNSLGEIVLHHNKSIQKETVDLNEFSAGISVQLNKSETKELWENMRNLKLYGKETPDLEDEVRYHSHLDDSLFSLKDSYFALSHRIYSIQNESYSEFNFGTKYFDTIVGGPETILIVDMFGATNEEILVRDPSSNMDFQGWFDSIVQLNYPPEESDLMLFDAKQKADLHLRWIEARANVNGFIQRPNEVVLKWWDFPNPSAHAIGSYYLSLYPTDGESDSDCTFEHLVWSIDNENIRFPVMAISNIELQEKTVEKFQKSTKTLKWVDLLLSEKAGKIIPKSEMDEKKFDQLTGGLIKELIFNP